ncbi:DUF421 domain-containing protein [Effusibacillus consociatus]|uniref:DUF421 domain-containing protein n=1 Tax=Effusibacillus consociatus TaxID=1117041 RepID=A0ABV9Q5J9_9BACL
MAFHLGDIVTRTFLGFGLLLLSALVLGKKMISQMSYFDFVTYITLGSLTGAIILDHHISLADLILAIAAFSFISFLTSVVSLKNRKVRKIIGGTALELIREGKILEEMLEQSRISMENLVSQLRLKGVFEIQTVKQAFLEPNGELSVLLAAEARPLTLGDYQRAPVPEENLPVELIIDGTVMTEKLVKAGLDLAWLLQELDKHGVNDYKDIAYAVLTSKNKLYLDKYRDDLHGAPRTRG